ncbi:hypothetical protein MAM1_0038c02773 [Mucor ambiguus]|uniref:Uncharacterized protein n=1 Tax=Mucor ambiguus TaxID=91626 RepID=A0A0C9LT27_9FUNG|nr:hypothetical protein MAM1_0038c02773 [Mucor ambiguus]
MAIINDFRIICISGTIVICFNTNDIPSIFVLALADTLVTLSNVTMQSNANTFTNTPEAVNDTIELISLCR